MNIKKIIKSIRKSGIAQELMEELQEELQDACFDFAVDFSKGSTMTASTITSKAIEERYQMASVKLSNAIKILAAKK